MMSNMPGGNKFAGGRWRTLFLDKLTHIRQSPLQVAGCHFVFGRRSSLDSDEFCWETL
jgi:hypothetical protein